MNVIIVNNGAFTTAILYNQTANAIAGFIDKAKELGCTFEDGFDIADADDEISGLMADVEEQLAHTGKSLLWLDMNPLDNTEAEDDELTDEERAERFWNS